MSDELQAKPDEAVTPDEAGSEVLLSIWWGVLPLLILGSGMLVLLWRYPLPVVWKFSLRAETMHALLEWLRLLCLVVFSIHFGRGVFKLVRRSIIPLGNGWRCLVNLIWYGGLSAYLY